LQLLLLFFVIIVTVKPNIENQATTHQEMMTNEEISMSKKYWQTPTVELISIAQGNASRGVEGASTIDHNFTPARSASRYHS